MDVPLAATALLSRKRPRDVNGFYSLDESADQTSTVKRICGPLVEDVNMTSISEKVYEVRGLLYEVNELDEAQEKRVYGVMRSLEEEIGISDHLDSTCILLPEVQGVELTYLPPPSQESNFVNEFSLVDTDATISTCCSEELESFELPSILESICSLNESRIVDISTLMSGSIHELEDRPVILLSEDRNYLLEASDDELGISTSPSYRSVSLEADVSPQSLLTSATTSSNSEAVDFEPWHYEWECSAESFYEIAPDAYFPAQEWLRNTKYINPSTLVASYPMYEEPTIM